MDEVTQQNSALVEENAATAKTLENQAVAMNEQVAVFHLGDDADHGAPAVAAAKQPMSAPASKAPARIATPAAKPAAKAAAKPTAKPKAAAGMNGGGPVGRMQNALAAAIKDSPEWEEF
jgi:hypothetical protein